MRTVVGLSMVAISGLVVFGGVTGRLAPILASLFSPQLLEVR